MLGRGKSLTESEEPLVAHAHAVFPRSSAASRIALGYAIRTITAAAQRPARAMLRTGAEGVGVAVHDVGIGNAAAVGQPLTAADTHGSPLLATSDFTCVPRSPVPKTKVVLAPRRIAANDSSSFMRSKTGFSASKRAVFA